MSKTKKELDWLAGVVVVGFMLAITVGVLGLRLWITGGDWRCVFAEDPALCATVSEVGK